MHGIQDILLYVNIPVLPVADLGVRGGGGGVSGVQILPETLDKKRLCDSHLRHLCGLRPLPLTPLSKFVDPPLAIGASRSL